jgi:large repetitive protein
MRRRARRTAYAGTALALLLAVPAFAASFTVVSARLTAWQSATSVATCASPGTRTATASADSWVDQSSPLTTYATDSNLRVRSKSSSANARALVRFTLPALTANCTVSLARLRLYSSSAMTGRTLQAVRVNATWAESTVTWATQPATTGTAATVASGTGWREWTVTSQAAAMYSGANNGFLVRDATEGATAGPEQSLHAREKGPDNPPQLVLTFG